MPQVLADQHATWAKRSIEAAQALPGREIASFLEHAVVGQVQLAVNVNHLPARKIGSRVMKPVAWRLLDKPHDDVQVCRGALQLGREAWPPTPFDCAQGHVRHLVQQAVPGERQLGEDDKTRTFLPRPRDGVKMLLEIRLEIPQSGRDLGQRHANGLHHASFEDRPGKPTTGTRCCVIVPKRRG
jgi:hypothetical protein